MQPQTLGIIRVSRSVNIGQSLTNSEHSHSHINSSDHHQSTMAMTAKVHTGLDFQDLARGGERNYSCSYLVNLDPDLLMLTNPAGNYVDQARHVLAGHTSRIIEQIKER